MKFILEYINNKQLINNSGKIFPETLSPFPSSLFLFLLIYLAKYL